MPLSVYCNTCKLQLEKKKKKKRRESREKKNVEKKKRSARVLCLSVLRFASFTTKFNTYYIYTPMSSSPATMEEQYSKSAARAAVLAAA